MISSKIYFSRRVVLRDEFLRYWILSDRKVWCQSSQTHLQSRSFEYPGHLYNLIYGNKALCGFLSYLKFSPNWSKTTRFDMRTPETDLRSLKLILCSSESPKTIRIDPWYLYVCTSHHKIIGKLKIYVFWRVYSSSGWVLKTSKIFSLKKMDSQLSNAVSDVLIRFLDDFLQLYL